jgi:hypothetical protein
MTINPKNHPDIRWGLFSVQISTSKNPENEKEKEMKINL